MHQLESKGLIVHTSGGVSKGGGFGGLLERSGAGGNELLCPCWQIRVECNFSQTEPRTSTSWEGKQSTGAWHGGSQSVQLLQTDYNRKGWEREKRELRDRKRQPKTIRYSKS